MANHVPDETIRAFAQTIYRESRHYGFDNVALVKLINSLMDTITDRAAVEAVASAGSGVGGNLEVRDFPLRSARLEIRRALPEDAVLIQSWCGGAYGEYFLLSSATAQRPEVEQLLRDPQNEFGIVSLRGGKPVATVAFLDINPTQRRAELRKLVGVPDERGKGYAEEATALWIEYGRVHLGLEKVYVSTLQTHLRNIKLNESVGFRVEGVLRGEVRVGDARHDVLRMGLSLVPPTVE